MQDTEYSESNRDFKKTKTNDIHLSKTPHSKQQPDIVRVVRGRGDPCVEETKSWFLLHEAQLELANKSKSRSLHLKL